MKLSGEDREAMMILLTKRQWQLTRWEEDFLHSLRGRVDVTEKQRDILNQIWTDIMEYGRDDFEEEDS